MNRSIIDLPQYPNETRNEIVHRFCVDMGIPLHKNTTADEFIQNLPLYELHYPNVISDWNLFIATIINHGGYQQYVNYHDETRAKAVSALEENPYMKEFMEFVNTKIELRYHQFTNRDIFKIPNNGKVFLSFDMKKACFNSLRRYNPRIVKGKDTYEEYLKCFTKEPYLLKSKRYRQSILGKVGAHEQGKYEKYLMEKVMDIILSEYKESQVVYFSADEIILQTSKDELKEKEFFIHSLLEDCEHQGILLRAEPFVLHSICMNDGTKYLKHIGFYKEVLTENGHEEYVLKAVLTKYFVDAVCCLYDHETPNGLTVIKYDSDKNVKK